VRSLHLVLPYMSRNSRILQFASSAAFFAPAKIQHLCSNKGLCIKLQPGFRERTERKGNLCDCCVSGTCGYRNFFEVAETTGSIPLYKRLVMAKPRKVVELALRDSIMKKPVSVYGITMKAFRLLCKVVPHGIILKAL